MSKFHPIQFYANNNSGYTLLPFRFTPLDADRYVATNVTGQYCILTREALHQFATHRLPPDDPSYSELRSKQFLIDDRSSIAPDLLAIQLRTRYERLAEFTGLHIFVVSLRCEHSCPYCQVSRQSQDKRRYDMSIEDADAALRFVFRSPSPNIKIEFQGGEPLLNFALIRHVVERVRQRTQDKNVTFVIATNLALIDKNILEFCRVHDVYISTSLDGPEDLHNRNRPRVGRDSYQRVIEGIRLVRAELGRDKVSALMTTTEASLKRVKEIVDEYVRHDFDGIFLRPISPYGFAVKTRSYRAYDPTSWFDFFQEGLEYIIDLNRNGVSFQEYYSSVVLAKMLTSLDPGYVDLMSPSGIGIAAVVYNYDGDIYASDEGRMLAEMGDHHFRLGNVQRSSYEDVFLSDKLLDSLEASFTYSAPICHDCAFEPYCGADPVFHWARYKDVVGRKPESEFCKRNLATFRYLIRKMESDRFVKQLFMKWANRC